MIFAAMHSCKVLSRGVPTPHDKGICEFDARRRVADCWVRGVKSAGAAQHEKSNSRFLSPCSSMQTLNLSVNIEVGERGRQSVRNGSILAAL